MSNLPLVSLIGQPNAGKSSLLNRLAGRKIAITAKEAGTTRDRVAATIDHQFILIDTAGLKPPIRAEKPSQSAEQNLESSIQAQITDAVAASDLLLLALDATVPFSHLDQKLVRAARRNRRSLLLILNKTDRKTALPDSAFRALGVPPERILRVSATTGQGIKTLKSAILTNLPKQQQFNSPNSPAPVKNSYYNIKSDFCQVNSTRQTNTDPAQKPIKLTLIGRPNVGKSSLFNALAGLSTAENFNQSSENSSQNQPKLPTENSIVSPTALVSPIGGTTRDINRLNLPKLSLEILDTAGLNRPGRRANKPEQFSALRTLAAIEEADLCALLIDAASPHVKLDQTLAGQIIKAGKGIMLIVTKTDLIKPAANPSASSSSNAKTGAKTNPKTPSPTDLILDRLAFDFNFIPYAPVVLTSAKTGANLTKIIDLAREIIKQRHHQIKTGDLNKILQAALRQHPPAGQKQTRPKLNYLVQTDTNPPWFVVYGHHLDALHWSYRRYLERQIREFYPFIGTPLFISYREAANRPDFC